MLRPHDDMNSEEHWLPIPGNLHYEASTHGRIRSVVRPGKTRWSKPKPSVVLKPSIHRGYETVSLRGGAKPYRTTVHKLVARAFIGPRPAGHEINHKDGDKRHNTPYNLEYVTPEENRKHALRNGLDIGRLSPEQVMQIKVISEYSEEDVIEELAMRFGVDPLHVKKALNTSLEHRL